MFGLTTGQMKAKLKVPENRPLADFLPTISIKAKDFASEITVFNTKERNLNSESLICDEHVNNNEEVRKLLIKKGIKPEELPASEDVKKVQRILNTEKKKTLKPRSNNK